MLLILCEQLAAQNGQDTQRVVELRTGRGADGIAAPFRVMVACADRRLGIHASALLVVYVERRSTLFHGGAMMSSRPVRRTVSPGLAIHATPRFTQLYEVAPWCLVSFRERYLHATQWAPLMSGLILCVEQYFPGPMICATP